MNRCQLTALPTNNCTTTWSWSWCFVGVFWLQQWISSFVDHVFGSRGTSTVAESKNVCWIENNPMLSACLSTKKNAEHCLPYPTLPNSRPVPCRLQPTDLSRATAAPTPRRASAFWPYKPELRRYHWSQHVQRGRGRGKRDCRGRSKDRGKQKVSRSPWLRHRLGMFLFWLLFFFLARFEMVMSDYTWVHFLQVLTFGWGELGVNSRLRVCYKAVSYKKCYHIDTKILWCCVYYEDDRTIGHTTREMPSAMSFSR